MNMIVSEYYSEDSSKTSFVIANPIGSTFRYKAQCMEQGYVVRVINFFKDRKSTRLNSSHMSESRMPSSA